MATLRNPATNVLPILTIGHSTRPLDAFLDVLRRQGATWVADVRALPRSRRHPWFSGERLAAALGAVGLDYTHLSELGGLRRPRPDSPNAGWHDDGFRGFADHMTSAAFAAGLAALLDLAGRERVAVMCAEAVPQHCHRSLIADALVVRGAAVEHILGPDRRQPHGLTPFAQVHGTRITYPAAPRLL